MNRAATRTEQRPQRLIVLAVLSLSLHALVVLQLIYGGTATRHASPPAPGVGASAMASTTDPVDALILIAIQDTASSADALPIIASNGQEKPSDSIQIASADARRAPDPSAAQSTSVDSPRAPSNPGRAVLFGQYLEQITARVERAWIRPRTPIETGSFRCRVRIAQGPHGEVHEVTMESCNGDLGWQLSLARAIDSASPLSAPPDPSVFASTLVMEFRSETYQLAGSEQGFESPMLTAAN